MPCLPSVSVQPSTVATALTIERIILPVDFSACAERALPRALALADKFEAEVHLLHVLPPLPLGSAVPTVQQHEVEEFSFWREERVRTRLNALRLTYRHSLGRRREIPLHLAVSTARHPAEGITRYAEQHDAALIVMGTHGWSTPVDGGLGSVAKQVLEHAPCPVMTVPVYRQVAGIVRRVLLPLDARQPDSQHIRYGDALAALLDCPLVVLYPKAGPATLSPAAMCGSGCSGDCRKSPETVPAVPTTKVSSILRGIQHMHLQAPEVTCHGVTDNVIESAIGMCEREEADVVIASHMMGAHTLAHSATCSVLMLGGKV